MRTHEGGGYTGASTLYTPFGPQPLPPREAANDNVPCGKPPVIALSGAAGSGKSTAAAHFVDKGYTLVKFAQPLKEMLRAIGLSDRHIEGDLKERPCDILQGKTPRQAMQWLGTEWGRARIDPHFWIGLWERAAIDVLDEGGRVVVDDCRFPNEADAVRKLGGIVVRLARRGGIGGAHVSEVMEWEADEVIANDGDRAALHERLDRAAA